MRHTSLRQSSRSVAAMSQLWKRNMKPGGGSPFLNRCACVIAQTNRSLFLPSSDIGLLSAVQRFDPESSAPWITMRSTTLFVTFLAMCVAVSLAGRSKGGDGLSKLLKEGRAARSNQDMQACLVF
jgi:hypothetical protein